jgi:U2 small nuclear ribonucleoprotein A'
MRLSTDLIEERADQVVDPNNSRAIILRGLKISIIENLGITRDQYGCIDLSDNDIVKISNIPKLIRLRTLLLANNSISRIAQDAFDFVPELTSLVLSNNRIANLQTLLPIGNLKRLERLSLIHNPVAKDPHYRFFLIHLLNYSPAFRFLDFERITDAQRASAKQFFTSAEGRALLKNLVPETHVDDEPGHLHAEPHVPEKRAALAQDVLDKIRIALMEATDMDVVSKLERALKTGQIGPDVSSLIGIA